MKISKTLLFLFIFPFSICYGQVKTEDRTDLFNTFRFIKEQQSTLINIKNSFPQLSIEANIAELEFNKNHSQALSNIHLEVRKEVGSNFDQHLTKIINKSNQKYISKRMSEKEAFSYIKKVKNRAKGNILSPYLEVFKKYGKLKKDPTSYYATNNLPHVVKS